MLSFCTTAVIFHLQNWSYVTEALHPGNGNVPFPAPFGPWQPRRFLFSRIWLLKKSHVTSYSNCPCDWFISLSQIRSLGFTHFIVQVRISFFSREKYVYSKSCLWIHLGMDVWMLSTCLLLGIAMLCDYHFQSLTFCPLYPCISSESLTASTQRIPLLGSFCQPLSLYSILAHRHSQHSLSSFAILFVCFRAFCSSFPHCCIFVLCWFFKWNI